jgi:hypothetical protein
MTAICMDRTKLNAMRRIGGRSEGKLRLAAQLCRRNARGGGPLVHGRFETTYRDVTKGCAALIGLASGDGRITKRDYQGDRFKILKGQA